MVNIPVITYHAIGDFDSPLWIKPSLFESHLQAIVKNNYQTISLATLFSLLNKNHPLPSKTIVLTFDDGYESFYTEAWPKLQKYGLTATVFLITDFCGKNNRWQGHPKFVPQEKLLNWKQIQQLASEGCNFGAHTKSHIPLSTIPLDTVRQEIKQSKEIIETKINSPVTTFAYPYGDTNQQVTRLIQEYFDGVVGTKLGFVKQGDNPFLLDRIDSFYLNPFIINNLQTFTIKNYFFCRHLLRSFRRQFQSDWH